MANVDAFNDGFDAGMGGKSKKKKPKDDDQKEKRNLKPVKEIHTSDGQTLTPSAMPKQFKKGGKVKRTGVAKVHRGELVLTAREAKKYKKKSHGRKWVASKG